MSVRADRGEPICGCGRNLFVNWLPLNQSLSNFRLWTFCVGIGFHACRARGRCVDCIRVVITPQTIDDREEKLAVSTTVTKAEIRGCKHGYTCMNYFNTSLFLFGASFGGQLMIGWWYI